MNNENIPSHLQALRTANVKKAELALPNKQISTMDWDRTGRLIIKFSDGTQMATSRVPVSENIEQFVSISTNPVFDYVQMNTEANVGEAALPGMLTWNQFEDCLDIRNADGSTLQVGLENYIDVINNTGQTLPNGSVVKFSGVALQEIPQASALQATSDFYPLLIIGVLTNALEDGQRGRATVLGKVRDLDTTGTPVGEVWQQGDLLWASPTQPGKLTKVKPSAPNPSISVAAVLKVSSTDGVILVRPTIFPRLFYAKYMSLVSQSPALPNTPYVVSFEVADIESGVDIVDNSKIVISQSGLYSFDFRLQLTSTNSSAKNIYIWARKNGTDVPNSTTKVSVSGSGTELAPSWNFVYTMQQGDYFELMYAVDNTGLLINAPSSTAFCPATPSAVIKVNQIDL